MNDISIFLFFFYFFFFIFFFFLGGGGGCQNKWAQFYYLQFIKAMGIYCICMFYLNEHTICPILTGKHIKCTLIMHINILCKICFSIFDGLCFILDMPPWT